MAIAITGDLDWVGDLILYLEALDGGPAADVAGYAFTSSGDIEYSCSMSEPVDPDDRLLGLYRCVAKTAGGVIAGVGYVTIVADATSVSIRSERASVLNSGALDPVLEAVADVQASIDAGGSPVFTAVVVARIATGAAAGWPESLTIGDAYLSENAGAQPLFIKDVADNILSGLGTKNFADADFVATLRLAPLTDGTRTLDTPPTTIEVKSTDVVGILYNDDTAGAEYFELQIPRAKTLLGVTKTKYSCQFIMNWGEDNTFERTVNLGEIKFLRKNAPGA